MLDSLDAIAEPAGPELVHGQDSERWKRHQLTTVKCTNQTDLALGIELVMQGNRDAIDLREQPQVRPKEPQRKNKTRSGPSSSMVTL